MRHVIARHFFRVCFAAIIALSGISSGAAAAESGGTAMSTAATVSRASGQVRATRDAKNWQMLKPGDSVTPGMLIQTAKKKASLDLDLGEPGLKVKLSENSVLGIKSLNVKGPGADAARHIELDLRAGQMQGRIPASATRLDCEVEFPAGVVGTRSDLTDPQGTVFALRSTGALAVASGKMVVSLAAAGTEAQVVAAGQQFDPAIGRVTELPKAALDRMLEDSRDE